MPFFAVLGYLYVGSLGAFSTILGVAGSAIAACVYGYTTSPLRLDFWKNLNIKRLLFINNDKCIVFSLWALLFHILGCITLFYTPLIHFFIVGTILSVTMLLLEHLIKDQTRFRNMMALLWHLGWGLIISICTLVPLTLEFDFTFLPLYVISLIIICYMLSRFIHILIPVLIAFPIITYLGGDFAPLANGDNGFHFIKGTIFLSFLTMVIFWRVTSQKNRRLEKELKILEKISQKYYVVASKVKHDDTMEKMLNIKSIAEKRFVTNMYLALKEIEMNNLLVSGLDSGKILPIKLPPRKIANEICLRTLCVDLKNFVSFDVARTKISFDTLSTVDKINLNICVHYVYQLLFSVVYNMVYLVNSGCRIQISFDIIGGEFCITLGYTGISFSKDELVKFTKGRQFMNAFILTFSDIFHCIKDIGGTYAIDKAKEGGVIKINKFIYDNIIRL